MRNYRNYKVWEISLELSKKVILIIANQKPFLRNTLGIQIIRASVSVPSNIAEGSAMSRKNFIRFLNYSRGSSYELDTQLRILQSINEDLDLTPLLSSNTHTQVLLSKLINKLSSGVD